MVADELLPRRGLLALWGWREAPTFENVTHRLVADVIAQLGQSAGYAVITPAAIVLCHFNEDSPQQATGYQKEMHSDEKPRFLKLFPLSGNPIASYGESVRLTLATFFHRHVLHSMSTIVVCPGLVLSQANPPGIPLRFIQARLLQWITYQQEFHGEY
jgi:hypothetical protein